MGRLEKIVVLTVLFLVAVVLGVALTPTAGTSSGGSKGPLQAEVEAAKPPADASNAGATKGLLSAEGIDPNLPTAGGSAQPQATPGGTAGPTTPPTGQNNGAAPGAGPEIAVAPTPAPAPPAPAPQPPVSKYILTLEGLEATSLPDMMIYTWKQGDSFAGLAQRFYGSKDKVGRLTTANEGRSEASLAVDERLWIPIAESNKSNASADGRYYVVKTGDMLGSISQQFYGTAKKWPKILDANRDQLPSPEKLKPGMKLRIPE